MAGGSKTRGGARGDTNTFPAGDTTPRRQNGKGIDNEGALRDEMASDDGEQSDGKTITWKGVAPKVANFKVPSPRPVPSPGIREGIPFRWKIQHEK
jgi:hypothetical protein